MDRYSSSIWMDAFDIVISPSVLYNVAIFCRNLRKLINNIVSLTGDSRVTISPEYIRPSRDAFDSDPFGYGLAWHRWGVLQTLAGSPVDLEKRTRVCRQFFQILSLWHKSIEK